LGVQARRFFGDAGFVSGSASFALARAAQGLCAWLVVISR
jgi:hypothetical protein